ncbi:hypothetical protein CRUP_004151, partial [Coryphaenoides rupestris]
LGVQRLGGVCVQHGRHPDRLQRALRPPGGPQLPVGPLPGPHPLPEARNDHQGVPRRGGDLRAEPPGHVQPRVPGGPPPPGGAHRRRLQVHQRGGGPGGRVRRQLPGPLPRHWYV